MSKFKPPSLPLHPSFMSARRQRELGLDGDVVVIEVPAKRSGFAACTGPGTGRTPEELAVLQAVAKSRGWGWAQRHEALILSQARKLGELDRHLASVDGGTFRPPSLPLHPSFASAARQRELGLGGDTVVIAVPVPAKRSTRKGGTR